LFVSGSEHEDIEEGRRREEMRGKGGGEIHTFINLILLLQTQIKEPLIPVHDLVLELERNRVPGDLEEAIVEAAVAHIIYELLLCGGVVAVKCFILN
jgi:hypothetical protein